MATFTKVSLSESISGKPISIVSTASSSATLIHTANPITSGFDEVWLWATFSGEVNPIINLSFGNELSSIKLETDNRTQNLCPGLILNNGNTVSAYLDYDDGNYSASNQSFRSEVTFDMTSPGYVNWPNHGLYLNAGVIFRSTATLPTGITAGTVYYVISTTKDSFTISTTQNGAAINFTRYNFGVHTCHRVMTTTIAAPGVMTVNNHQFQNLQGFMVNTTGSLPGGLLTDTIYYVSSASYAEDTFRFTNTMTAGASSVTTYGTQSGDHSIMPIATVTTSATAGSTILYPNHGLSIGEKFYLTTTGTLPTGVSPNQIYYVSRVGYSFNKFYFSSTYGGPVVYASGEQSGVHTIRKPLDVKVYGFVNRIT